MAYRVTVVVTRVFDGLEEPASPGGYGRDGCVAALAFVLRCITFASAIPLILPVIYTVCNAHLVPQCALWYERLDVLCDDTRDQKARGDACPPF